ncbi:NADP-dependent oxidoreductase [Actinomycetospora lutea]|uniref:NADP-dependent oxidoreductase n=1 Tax=Actinomycetospora lutea TaxID=663604 RepID=UPI00236654D9|nr:NADP-dependent oxidoreductase [Actinomycetospora lutea]MDD7939088.1 NADP-dependent oxidoreductase [Actinomycetospora lutea]
MRSVAVTAFGGAENLAVREVPDPVPGPHQVLVEVTASTVNAIDVSARAGLLVEAGLMTPALPVGPGWDVAGVVRALGTRVGDLQVGARVIGLCDLLAGAGAHAELVVLDRSAVASAPATWTAEQAATLPLNGLTAVGALDATGLHIGDTLLVTGAAGGVGGYVLELARDRGIATVAAVRSRHAGRARARGAGIVVATDELTEHTLAQEVRARVPGGVDAVVDAARAGIAAHDALRSRGVFVALVRPFAPPPVRGTTVIVHEVAADGRRLAGLARLADTGRLTTDVAEILPLDEVRRAHRLVEAGGLDGRVVIRP